MTLMKAAVVHSFGQPLQIDEVPIPEVTPGQVLVKVVASGVCQPIFMRPMATGL